MENNGSVARFTVVTVDFAGHVSWIQYFNTEADLRKHLISEMHPNGDGLDEEVEEGYAEMPLKELMMVSDDAMLLLVRALDKDV